MVLPSMHDFLSAFVTASGSVPGMGLGSAAGTSIVRSYGSAIGERAGLSTNAAVIARHAVFVVSAHVCICSNVGVTGGSVSGAASVMVGLTAVNSMTGAVPRHGLVDVTTLSASFVASLPNSAKITSNLVSMSAVPRLSISSAKFEKGNGCVRLSVLVLIIFMMGCTMCLTVRVLLLWMVSLRVLRGVMVWVSLCRYVILMFRLLLVLVMRWLTVLIW